MAGHSKWATTKHKKAAIDKKRGKLFAKLIKQVEVAARQGGGDVDANPTLRTMFQKARDNSVPLDTIERAVKRGTGELEGVNYESITYEGYAPGGVALLIDVLTDNRNRTGSEIRSLLSKNGGSLGEPGAVAWQFERKGVVNVDRDVDEEAVMMVGIDHGALDVEDYGEHWLVTCDPSDVESLRSAIGDADIRVLESDVRMIPKNSVEVADKATVSSVLNVIELLDDHDDVQDIFSNIDIPDDLLAES